MELTLAAICLALIALATGAAITLSRGRSVVRQANIRAIAQERGLVDSEIRQLEHLSRLLNSSSLVELLLSPRRFNVASARYLDNLRASEPTEAQYFGRILELTRLRRRIHPPKSIIHRLDTTRELSECISVSIQHTAGSFCGVLWAVNEDHIDIRLQPHMPSLTAGDQVTCRVEGALATAYEFETEVRLIADTGRCIIRVEHARTLQFIRFDKLKNEKATQYVIPPNRPQRSHVLASI